MSRPFRHVAPLLVVVLFVAPALAGCLTPEADAPPAAAPPAAAPPPLAEIVPASSPPRPASPPPPAAVTPEPTPPTPASAAPETEAPPEPAPEEVEEPAREQSPLASVETLPVHVDAGRGPFGPEPARIDRRFWCMNVADWRPEDYRPEPEPEFETYLRALGPGMLRWPAGHTSQEWRWSREEGPRNLTPEHVDDFLALAQRVGAEPLLAVNLKRGTPEQAADFVRYVNVDRGRDVTWWALGNEPDLGDEFNEGPLAYAEQYLAFARAMRAVDPNIKLVGGELMTGAHVVGIKGREDWMARIAEQAGGEMDALSWHYYPLDSAQENPHSPAYPTVENLFQETAGDWAPSGLAFVDGAWPHLAATRDAHAPGAELWVTEFAEDSGRGGMEGLVDRHAGALWAADALGRFANHGADVICRFLFKGSSMHNYALVSKYGDLRPEYATYWLLSREYGDRIVDAESADIAHVAAHASLREDGKLAVLLVNKRTEARDVHLRIDGFDVGSAERHVILGESYDARNVTVNGKTLGLDNLLAGIPGEPVGPDAMTAFRVEPLSVTLLVISPRA